MKPAPVALFFTSFDEHKHTLSVLASVLIQFCSDINNNILPFKNKWKEALKLICGGGFGTFGDVG